MNKRRTLFTILVLLAGWTTSGACADVESKETIRKTLKFSGNESAWQLRLDNLNGSILLTGYDGKTVELIAHRTAKAESQTLLDEAGRDVTLKIEEKGEVVDVLVDEPGRCRDGSWSWRDRRRGYAVRYDFEVKVPAAAALWLRNVNGDKIRVSSVTGRYDIENINGGVEMTGIGGSGRAYSLNGKLLVTHSANPKQDSYFGSLNGAVEVTFLPGFSADLAVKTFNGGAYTDFPVTSRPLPASATGERKEGRFVYKSNHFTGLRIGNGGPQIKFDAFNGDIRILEKGKAQ